MPTHVYIPLHDPPHLWDRVKVHTSEVGLALLSVVSGIQVLMAPLFKSYAPSQSLKGLDPELGFALALFVGVGGALALLGVLWSGHKVSTGWVLEEVGWLFAGFGWVGYAALVAYAYPYSTISYGIAFAIGAMSFARAYVVYRIDRAIRPGAETAKKIRQGGET